MVSDAVSHRGVILLAWSTVPVPFAIAAVALRFMSRYYSRNIGLDDWTIALALILELAQYSTIVAWATVGNVGRPAAQLDSDGTEKFLKV